MDPAHPTEVIQETAWDQDQDRDRAQEDKAALLEDPTWHRRGGP